MPVGRFGGGGGTVWCNPLPHFGWRTLSEKGHLCCNLGGVTIYRYIAIHEEFILHRNTKFVSQYIEIFLCSNKTVNFSFSFCLVAIASPESICLSHLYPYKRSSYSHVCIYRILILQRKVENKDE